RHHTPPSQRRSRGTQAVGPRRAAPRSHPSRATKWPACGCERVGRRAARRAYDESMLLSHRVLDAGSLALALETHSAMHASYRVSLVRNARVVTDDALIMRAFERHGRLGRPVVTIVLEGDARIRAHDKERWLSAGDVSIVERKGAIEHRSQGARY